MKIETGVTSRLAEWASACELNEIPKDIRAEGVRTFLNWLGCAIGGSRHITVDQAIAGVSQFAGRRDATVLGRSERLDGLNAALINGISSHVLDYDDTHLKTIIHPGGPVASAGFAIAETESVNGADFLAALIIGVEACCRIGNAVYPDHYDRGWHITGTAGVFGAAIAVGRLLRLDPKRMAWAIGLAATQPTGLREMFGTMTKSFHPGRAAQNGALAAVLAHAGFDSSERAIEAPRGFARVLSSKQDYAEITEGLGETWEAGLNSYKPFACGIVIHPTIDACLQIREELGEVGGEVAEVRLRTHPLVLELTGKTEPRSGLQGKFSVYHAAATALLYGDGSPSAFTDERVNDAAVIALRDRVKVEVDPECHEASAHALVLLKDGRRVERWVERAIGSSERPLTDTHLEGKFRDQVAPVLGGDACDRLVHMTWNLPDIEDCQRLALMAGTPPRE